MKTGIFGIIISTAFPNDVYYSKLTLVSVASVAINENLRRAVLLGSGLSFSKTCPQLLSVNEVPGWAIKRKCICPAVIIQTFFQSVLYGC